MQKIAIVGAGMMGSALSLPARDRGQEVRLIGTPLDDAIIHHARNTNRHLTMDQPLPDGLSFHLWQEAKEGLAGCDLVIGGVSSFGIDWFIKVALPLIPESVPILMVTKGLICQDDGQLITFPDHIKARTNRTVCAVGGPCTSYELAQRQHSAVAFCGENRAHLLAFREALATDYYHISLSRDVIGVEAAVALKNAYALAVTLAVGEHIRRFGENGPLAYNPQAALFGQSVREMRRLLALLGGWDEQIVYGAGDLYVTVFGGRTRRLGTLLGQGLTIDQALQRLSGVTLESVEIARRTVRAIRIRASKHQAQASDYPLLMHIGDLLSGQETAGIPWDQFVLDD